MNASVSNTVPNTTSNDVLQREARRLRGAARLCFTTPFLACILSVIVLGVRTAGDNPYNTFLACTILIGGLIIFMVFVSVPLIVNRASQDNHIMRDTVTRPVDWSDPRFHLLAGILQRGGFGNPLVAGVMYLPQHSAPEARADCKYRIPVKLRLNVQRIARFGLRTFVFSFSNPMGFLTVLADTLLITPLLFVLCVDFFRPRHKLSFASPDFLALLENQPKQACVVLRHEMAHLRHKDVFSRIFYGGLTFPMTLCAIAVPWFAYYSDYFAWEMNTNRYVPTPSPILFALYVLLLVAVIWLGILCVRYAPRALRLGQEIRADQEAVRNSNGNSADLCAFLRQYGMGSEEVQLRIALLESDEAAYKILIRQYSHYGTQRLLVLWLSYMLCFVALCFMVRFVP